MPARSATRLSKSITLIRRAIPSVGIQIARGRGLITTTSGYIPHVPRVVSPITCDITTYRARITPLGIRVTLLTVHIALIRNVIARVGDVIAAPRGHVPLLTINVTFIRHAITRISDRITTIGIRVTLRAIDGMLAGNLGANVGNVGRHHRRRVE